MNDIVETRTKAAITFTAITAKAATWMRDRFQGKTEYTYSYPEGAVDFRKRARIAKLKISSR